MSKKLLMTLALVMALSVPAYATISLNFNINAPSSGTISLAGDAPNRYLVGTDIPVESVNVQVDSASPIFLVFSDTVLLNFRTGNLLPSATATGGFLFDVYHGSGPISIRDATSGQTFLTGGFNTVFPEVTVNDTGINVFNADWFGGAGGAFLDSLDIVPGPGYWCGRIGLTYAGDPLNSSQILSGHVSATTPVPPSVLLLGSGLLGLAGWRRFRKG